MIKKIGTILLLFLLSFNLSIQIVEASSSSGTFKISINIVEPTQEIDYNNTVRFDPSFAVRSKKEGKVVMKISNAGSTIINTNVPWMLYADVPTVDNVKVYIRINNKNGWIPVDNAPVLRNGTTGEFDISWDIKVIADTYSELQPFNVNFKLTQIS